MKNRTYRNVMRAIKMIQAKGYTFDESRDMALNIFDQLEIAQDVYGDHELTAERLIKPLLSKSDYIAFYGTN